jgi:hypothetical protein
MLTLSVFALLAGIELADRAVIAHHACPHLAALTLMILKIVWMKGEGLMTFMAFLWKVMRKGKLRLA